MFVCWNFCPYWADFPPYHNRSFKVPCKPEVRQGAREESASPASLSAPAMNARDTTEVYIWRPYTGCGPKLYRKCHSHNTPGKRHDNTWVKLLAGNCTTSSAWQREQVWQKCKIHKTSVTVYGYPLECHVTFGDGGSILFDKNLVQILELSKQALAFWMSCEIKTPWHYKPIKLKVWCS